MNNQWKDSAPSNIALIKYMGKTDHQQNLPTNVSFSYTVDHLRTFVELEIISSSKDQWEPLEISDYPPLNLNEKSQQRYLNHLQFLKKQFAINESFVVRSANNFPTACGIASSASSFAALTKVSAQAALSLSKQKNDLSPQTLCQLSRQGSGSSCRSFFSGWVKWEGETVEPIELPYKDLIHFVCVAGSTEKEVSTSLAHKIVPTSLLFSGRIERAIQRYDILLKQLQEQQWEQAYQTSWAEFWDMHSLFETSQPHFGYMNAASLDILNRIRGFWQSHGDGPLVTMDAGPNVHVFFRNDQAPLAESFSSDLKNHHPVIGKDNCDL